MRNYAISARITAILTLVSFAAAMILHYATNGEETEFWCNVCLAVFGSGLLTFITSWIGYFIEKSKTLENFSYSTRFLLHIINKYDLNWDLEKKIDFFLDYKDIDKSLWDSNLGAIYFLFDPSRKNFMYIYKKIYRPIVDLNLKVSDHEFHFIWYKDGSGKNDVVMQKFVKEIEALFMEETTKKHTLEDGRVLTTKGVYNKLVRTISAELNGRYYDIMYGKKRKESEDA